VTPTTTSAPGPDSVRMAGAQPPARVGATTAPTPNTKVAVAMSPASETARSSTPPRQSATLAAKGSTTVATTKARVETVPETPPERRPPAVSAADIPEPILRFAAAVESGDVARIKQAYPGLTPNQQRQWEILFARYKPGRARFQQVRGQPSTEAGVTVVQFTMAVAFSDKTTGDVTTFPSTYRARLRREGPRLVLLSLSDAGRAR
jgi:hypothetical protein